MVLATVLVSSLYTPYTPTFLKKKKLTLFAYITKIIMSKNYLSRQTIYGNLCGSYLKKTLLSLMKNTSYKLAALLWELKWRSQAWKLANKEVLQKVCSQSRRKIANDLFLLATSSVCVHAFLSATKLNKLPLIICLRSFIYTTNLSVNSFIANVEADDSKTLYKYLKLLTSNLYSSLID